MVFSRRDASTDPLPRESYALYDVSVSRGAPSPGRLLAKLMPKDGLAGSHDFMHIVDGIGHLCIYEIMEVVDTSPPEYITVQMGGYGDATTFSPMTGFGLFSTSANGALARFNGYRGFAPAQLDEKAFRITCPLYEFPNKINVPLSYASVPLGKHSVLSPSRPPQIRNEGPVVFSVCGYPLRSLKLTPAGKKRAVAIFFHGGTSHARASELNELQQAFLSAGFVWYCMDLHGHGYSGKLGDPSHPLSPLDMPGLGDVLQDHLSFVQLALASEDNATLPFVTLAHATGVLTMLSLLCDLQRLYRERLRGFCMSSMGVAPPSCATSCRPFLYKLSSVCFPRATPIVGMELRAFVKGADVYSTLKQDPLRYQGSAPMIFWSYVLNAMALASSIPNLQSITRPFVYSVGTADRAWPISAAMYVYTTLGSQHKYKRLHVMNGAFHNVYAEPASTTKEILREWTQFCVHVCSH